MLYTYPNLHSTRQHCQAQSPARSLQNTAHVNPWRAWSSTASGVHLQHANLDSHRLKPNIISSTHMSDSEEYSREAAIAEFFNQTCATRASCDSRALYLVGGKVVPVEVQGVCSYTVYAGPHLKYVVQFRLKSLKLDIETAALATEVYGSLSPTVRSNGELGSEGDDAGKEPLLVYVMDRMQGLTHLDFILKYGYPQNLESNFAARKNLMTDIARYVLIRSQGTC